MGPRLINIHLRMLGKHVGYLPQRVQLFDGTIAENIARLDPELNALKVVAAAKKADAHDMILELPQGYDTVVSTAQSKLSGGQMQRIGLARALYGKPVIVVLDEPDSNLDSIGSEALNKAIRQLKAQNCAVLIMAHRPAAIRECDTLLVLDNGTCAAFRTKRRDHGAGRGTGWQGPGRHKSSAQGRGMKQAKSMGLL